MKLDWTKGLGGDGEAIEERKQLVKHSTQILSVINNILERWEKDYAVLPRPKYEDAGWPYHAADANGYLRALKQLKDLIAPDQEVE